MKKLGFFWAYTVVQSQGETEQIFFLSVQSQLDGQRKRKHTCLSYGEQNLARSQVSSTRVHYSRYPKVGGVSEWVTRGSQSKTAK